jgi:2-keto-4-pentenoate hydratase/2-oxohepta-3-ene-1,7-dioic acid hydratase in catechol pathway
MKLIRYREAGTTKTGIIIDGKYYDTFGFGEDYNQRFFGCHGLNRLQQYVTANAGALRQLSKDVILDCPIARPSQIICIGVSYAYDAPETKTAIPNEPIIFFKSTTSIAGPTDDVIIPKNSVKTDWELELSIVIGKKTSCIQEADALEYIAGYCLHNDISKREFQLKPDRTSIKGKSCDTFAPLGPFLATPDEISNVDDLSLCLTVNAKKMQNASTSHLVFKVPFLVSYLSHFITLSPGDVISTGTPSGLGLGLNPPVYLKGGEVIELRINVSGAQKQQVKE